MSDSIMKPAQTAGKPRMAFVDNIRWTVIAMVVMVHAFCTYSGLGSWYYHESTSLDVVSQLVFYLYEIFSQAFFMGILFFVAAAFTTGAYDRKGFGRFVMDRFLRLGVPTLFFMFVIHPVSIFIREAGTGHGMGLQGSLSWYVHFVTSGTFVRESGPLWFAFALLGFSVVYALIRLAADTIRRDRARTVVPVALTPAVVHRAAAALIAVIALGSFAVRLVQPIGTSWYNMQLCFFPQYIVLFGVGLWAGRHGLLLALPRPAGKVWLRLAFAVGVPVWFLLMGFGGALSGNQDAYAGGLRWQAAALAGWEAFFCVSFSIGLLSLYREKVNARTAVTGTLSDTSFGIYVFHTPVLIAASVLMRTVFLYPLAKTLIVGVAAWIVSLAIAFVARRIPGCGRLFA
jgi:hypothetical protein